MDILRFFFRCIKLRCGKQGITHRQLAGIGCHGYTHTILKARVATRPSSFSYGDKIFC